MLPQSRGGRANTARGYGEHLERSAPERSFEACPALEIEIIQRSQAKAGCESAP